MKKTALYILTLSILVSLGGCKKYLDVNTDPNAPTKVTEKLFLPAIESHFAFEVIGGFPVRTSSFWTKHLAYAVAGPHEGNYRLTENDVNDFWKLSSYNTVMQSCNQLIAQAGENGNPSYRAIAKIILAWNMSYITDAYGDAPFSDAFKASEGIIKPTYDSQKDIFDKIQTLLDEAIVDAGSDEGLNPEGVDFIYGGDMTLWQKLARTLKARFYLRLAYAPGNTPAAQADLALQALDAGAIADNSEMPTFAYTDAPEAQNPWYQFAIDGKWTTAIKPSIYYINMLKTTNDPRLEVQVDAVAEGDSTGLYIGVTNDAAPTPLINYSAIGSFYSAPGAPLYMMIYAEVPFIRAEAEYLKAGATVTPAVIAAYEEGITASMEMYGIADYAAYLVANTLSAVPATAYEQIMTQKYVANYLQFEAYNDYRRSGFPVLPVNDEIYPGEELDIAPQIDEIPSRFPYPSSERSYNPDNIPANVPAGYLDALKVKVWWDPS